MTSSTVYDTTSQAAAARFAMGDANVSGILDNLGGSVKKLEDPAQLLKGLSA
jgi:hypothetical protein